MGIDFRRADTLMSQQCLDEAQVSAALQQGSGKRVAQGVGRDGLLDTCCFGLPLNHD